MGELIDKVKGYVNEVVGKIKQVIGKVIDNDKLQVEGFVQEVKGDL